MHVRALVAAAAVILVMAPSAAAEVSSNWSGYALVAPDPVAPLAFKDVTGTWVQPRATCTVGRRDASAFWVGLGGYDRASTSLEQIGTAAECNGSSTTPLSYAWWELVPAASVPIPMVIRPGDRIVAAVLVKGQKITFSLRNVTLPQRFSKVMNARQALDVGSAEWIAEAPSECTSITDCRVIPLTNFGAVTFTNAAAIANEHSGTINDVTWYASPIQLITRELSAAGATPSAVSGDGRTFSVTWAQTLQQ